ncbi:Hsp20/alpha crystallin family protein [Streptomyces sp. NBC_01363]|nr:Hsp20/alpha crystallin family protein [Streptomyces sp. NBC_01363]MCX4729442.1 Hsp20/alpha crystallin family protein [Streptomyces sp. NBC_01363]MCX4736912.1 Hsp20/alpha crystallin family protein [Streptomyces sp. NBC_01363]
MDAFRDGDAFVVELDLPGVERDSIDLDVEQNVLTVKAERRTSASSDGSDVLIAERPTGSIQPAAVPGRDAGHRPSSYDGGVLRLTIPVAERPKPRRSRSGPETAHPRRSTSERQQSREGPALRPPAPSAPRSGCPSGSRQPRGSRIRNTRLKGASDDTGGRH